MFYPDDVAPLTVFSGLAWRWALRHWHREGPRFFQEAQSVPRWGPSRPEGETNALCDRW